jgi:hypothetical protein
MKCAACGNDARDDDKYCRVCGKYLFGNAHESQAGEAAAESAVSGSAGVSEERLCPCCQTPLKPGASFCGKCGLPADGRGGNPYAVNAKSEGAGGSDSAMAQSLMKEMNTMTWWIISGATFMALTALTCALPWLTHLKLLISHGYSVFVLFLGSGFFITHGGILLKTPSLAQKCGELCRNDRDLAKRISMVKRHVKDRWILLILNLVFVTAFISFASLLVVLSFLGLINGFIYAFTGSLQLPVTWNVLILLLWAAVISGALFLVCCIADLVIQAFMLFDFFKVKKVIGRMTVRGIKPPASL